MWTDMQIINQLGPKRAEELLRYTSWALICEGCNRKVAAQFLWRNATSLINEAVAELEAKKAAFDDIRAKLQPHCRPFPTTQEEMRAYLDRVNSVYDKVGKCVDYARKRVTDE